MHSVALSSLIYSLLLDKFSRLWSKSDVTPDDWTPVAPVDHKAKNKVGRGEGEFGKRKPNSKGPVAVAASGDQLVGSEADTLARCRARRRMTLRRATLWRLYQDTGRLGSLCAECALQCWLQNVDRDST